MIGFGALATLPVVIAVPAALLGRSSARRLPARAATLVLTALSLSVALVTGLLLCLAAVVGLAAFPPAHGLGHWSDDAVRDRVGLPAALGLACAVVATALVVSVGAHLIRLAFSVRNAVTAGSTPPPVARLVVIRDEIAYAYAVPGRHHRIVASTGLLKALDPTQRRVLLAHESSHLLHHHHRYVQLGRIAAAANPLVRPISRAIDLAVERWADEDAAREVGDRHIAARAISVAALVGPTGRAPDLALPAAQNDVLERVASLLRPPPRRQLWTIAFACATVACWCAGLLVIDHVHGLMELAEAVNG